MFILKKEKYNFQISRTPCSHLIPILKKVLFVLVLTMPFLQSCSTNRFLEANNGEKTWLTINKIEFDKTEGDRVKNKNNLVEQLGQRFQQRRNRKLFGIPRTYFYFISLDTINKNKFGLASDRTMRRVLGEEPVYIDSSKAERTAELMTTFLQNKGYFKAEVDYSVETNEKKSKGSVTYLVKSKGLYTIDTLIYQSKDTTILRILQDISEYSYLKSGEPIDIELYEKEVSRITNYLVNNGYANFYPQYINSLEAFDSSNTALNSKLIFEILPPKDKEFHQSYTIGDIFVYPEYNPNFEKLPQPNALINGVHFSISGEELEVKPKSLTNNIALKKGDLYKFENVEATRRQIGALGVFTTPTIKTSIDPELPDVMNFHILLTSNKKWELQLSGDVSYTERNNGPGITANLIGLTGGVSFSNRNLFRGAELLVLSSDVGVEIAPFNNSSTFFNSVDLGFQTDLYFPRFVEFPKVWNGFSKIFGSNSYYEKLKKIGISRVSTSYDWLNLIDNYDLHFGNVSFGHEIKLSAAKTINTNQAGIDILLPFIDEGSRFDMLLDDQPFLERSFRKQLMTGFFFKDINYIYDESFLGYNSYWYFSAYFDLSGLEVMTTDFLYNELSNKNDTLSIGDLDFSHYVKLDLDARRYWKFGGDKTLVARLNVGVVKPFYKSSDVPYVKQFYAGGANSIRGWYARGLGPGSHIDPISLDNQRRNQFYQAADFKIEMNLEYRFLIGRPFNFFNLHGAVFLDGGNIWTLDYDDDRLGSQLTFKTEKRLNPDTGELELIRNNLFNTLALSAGAGLRFDVSYFTFRTDIGLPIKNSFPDPNRNNSYIADYKKWQFRDIVWSLGLGYPF